ncbi:MAG: cation:dicarboxylase symporter family transporter [Clostridia bacterium]|nr:cation:dicarboxylase symporter family transporter [Clostridia bacterium]
MKIRKECTLMGDNSSSAFADYSREALLKAGFPESDTDFFVGKIVNLLDDYTACAGEGATVKYWVWKGLVNMEFRILIPGVPFDPFADGKGAQNRAIDEMVSVNLDNGTPRMSYKYANKCNIISISIPLAAKPKMRIKDPVVWGVILGLAFGLLLRLLPQEVNSFITHDVASPLLNILLKVISGVMGPVIFISLVSSTIALSSINDLTGLGFMIIRRFLLIILFLIVISVLVCGLIFQNFGAADTSFSLGQLFTMILDIIPTNLIDPFQKNNTAQLVIMGLLTGSGLLLLGNSGDELKRIIEQLNKWVMSVMKIVLLTVPAIPFLSIMTTLADGKGAELLEGWKFVVASYVIFALCTAIKAIKTSVRTGIRISDLWRMIKPIAKVSFTTGSTTAALRSMYAASDGELKVTPSFSSFWIPMSTAMLSPKTAVNVIISAFMAAQLESVPISVSFLSVMMLVAMELSLASPGVAAASTAMLTALGLPVNYVGLYATYRLLTDNFGAACCISYNVLEELEISRKLGEVQETTDETVAEPAP